MGYRLSEFSERFTVTTYIRKGTSLHIVDVGGWQSDSVCIIKLGLANLLISYFLFSYSDLS